MSSRLIDKDRKTTLIKCSECLMSGGIRAACVVMLIQSVVRGAVRTV